MLAPRSWVVSTVGRIILMDLVCLKLALLKGKSCHSDRMICLIVKIFARRVESSDLGYIFCHLALTTYYPGTRRRRSNIFLQILLLIDQHSDSE